jgi:hypothetical protein
MTEIFRTSDYHILMKYELIRDPRQIDQSVTFPKNVRHYSGRNNKAGKVYCLAFTDIEEEFFMPHHVGTVALL